MRPISSCKKLIILVVIYVSSALSINISVLEHSSNVRSLAEILTERRTYGIVTLYSENYKFK